LGQEKKYFLNDGEREIKKKKRINSFMLAKKFKIQKIACDFVRTIGKDPDTYLVRVEEESRNESETRPYFKVLFIPKRRRILGGGFRVYVKNDMSIEDIVYLQ